MPPRVERKYVIPGDLITQGDYTLMGNVLRVGNSIYATRVGMAEMAQGSVRVIPLSGPYIPRVDDLVVGKIVDYSAFGWQVDINSCFFATLPAQSVFGRDYSPAKDSLEKKFGIGALITAIVLAFDRTRDPILTLNGPGLGEVTAGEVVKVSSTKIPRLIGKRGSMIRTIERGTGCKLQIGQNGVIVIRGHPQGITKAKDIIKVVDEGAHTADLTQRVQELLGERGMPGEEGEEQEQEQGGEKEAQGKVEVE